MGSRRCLDCGTITTATRCPPCTRRRKAVRNLEARVANLVELMGIPTPPRCDVLVSLTADHEATNVGGRLTRPHNLSGPAWDFVRRHDRLPTTDEIHSYERFGAWKIRNVRAGVIS